MQPDAKRKPIVLAPEENAKIEATNVFALLNMDDDEDGDDTEADAKDGDGEEEAKEELCRRCRLVNSQETCTKVKL